MSVAYINNDNELSITFLLTGNSYTMRQDNPNWDTVIEKLNNEDYENLENLFSVKQKLQNYISDSNLVQIDDGGVKYKGKYIDNFLTKKIISFMNKNLPYKPLINFFEKVMQNPSKRAVDELYKFLEHGNMPILPNGNFVGYKAVDENWRDYHTGKYDNSVGNTLEMERNEVCDDANLGCSYGFHVGTIRYARGFGRHNGRVILVEVNPADCVSVPHDCNNEKLRTCKYYVVKEFERILEDDYDNSFDSDEEDEYSGPYDDFDEEDIYF